MDKMCGVLIYRNNEKSSLFDEFYLWLVYVWRRYIVKVLYIFFFNFNSFIIILFFIGKDIGVEKY